MTSHPSRQSLTPLLTALSLSPPPWPPSTLTCSFSAPPLRLFLPSLLSLSVRMKKGQCERKNRRVNRGERSRAFYTRYKYLQKCGWNTWNPHEEKRERGEHYCSLGFSAHAHETHMHIYTNLQQSLFSFFKKSFSLMAFRLAEWWSEWRDHPLTKGLLVHALVSVASCPAVASLSTVSNPI